MNTVKFSVVTDRNPFAKANRWQQAADAVKGGKVISVPIGPKGYARTCIDIHTGMRGCGVKVQTMKNDTGIYVRSKK